ncbi:Scarecrow-like protein 14 [Heracleum sosnowskyi]|uniref:Scarecrow-like protein 14 n=1 Tax=Heracleum sosnowskyi TaxID=360622 RepID=A0AAD8MI79_9APIA|nr:Scarecrow-like protein 14 [Heracleum sosnowskyi]
MVMDPSSTDFSDVLNGFEYGDEVVLPGFDSPPNYANTFRFKDELVDLSFLDIPDHIPEPDYNYAAVATTMTTSTSTVNETSPTGSSEMYSPDDNEFSDGVLKFLNQILMEEKIDEKPSMFYDPLALQAAEQSLYEALGKKNSPSPYGPVDTYQHADSRNDYFTGSSSEYSTSSGGTSSGSYYEPPYWVADSRSLKSSDLQNRPPDFNIDSRSQWSVTSENSLRNNISGVLDAPMSTQVIPNIFTDSNSILQFKKGMEEAKKFLPSIPQLVVNLDNYKLPSDAKKGPPVHQVKVEKDEEISLRSSRGRKHLLRQDSVIEDERSSKQLAVFEEEVELTEMFDKVLLCEPCCDKEEPIEFSPASLHENWLAQGSNGSKSRSKRTDSKSEAVDLRTLLISCAQSVASEDRMTAYEQLKLIRQYSSASGDASQRLANVFANGLEARMAGTGTQLYAALSSRRISATEKLKAYQAYLVACPFKKTSVFFANKLILEKSSNATTLHIIDFGIQYGFQWPVLIQCLSKRPGGPPKLRITGIELPQPGFRPAEYMEATGRRLRGYCERFNVSFEYNPIATQKWETITVEDLKIQSNEVVAVNCFLRFENLLDETVAVNNPRDAVLKLIREVNPAIFVQAIVNGSYSVPFFVTRFREALFHYSALFDILDTTMPCDDPERLNFEREFCGREVMNVIACEGVERVQRPETYKQWQIRNMKAGFKSLPLKKELLDKLKCKVKSEFHKDFVFDEDGQWMLTGWKGRILHGISAWEPA